MNIGFFYDDPPRSLLYDSPYPDEWQVYGRCSKCRLDFFYKTDLEEYLYFCETLA